MDATIIIPARLGSTRLPGKVLLDRTGWPLIRHVCESASRISGVGRVVVATDDRRVADAVASFGGHAVMTSPEHPSGTSRLAEAARALGLGPDHVVVNVQGDEPELEPALAEKAIAALRTSGCPVSTVAVPLLPPDDASDPNLVKVVLRADGRALYFSRAPVPFVRDAGSPPHERPLRHVGLYVYRRRFLDEYASLPPTLLERTEMLEQLRVLHAGHDVAVAVHEGAAPQGIDTPAQYEAFVARWALRTGTPSGSPRRTS